MASDKIERRKIGEPPTQAGLLVNAATPPAPSTAPSGSASANLGPPNLPPPGRGPAETRCIYFSDGLTLNELEGVCARNPKPSLSAVMAQLAKALVDAAKNHPETSRAIEVKAVIYV